MMAEKWVVERHSGRNADSWRIVFQGSEEKARRKFSKIEDALRQGGVRLIRPDDTVALTVNAPRLRFRW